MTDPATKTVPLADDIAAMAFIQSSFLCQGVAEEMLAELYRSGTVVDYGAGAVVFEQGGTDDGLYVVIEGSINIRKKHGDGEVDLASLDRQAIFGEIAVLTAGQPRTATAVTRVESRLIRFEGTVVRSVAESAPKFGRKLAGLMAGRTKDTEKKLGG